MVTIALGGCASVLEGLQDVLENQPGAEIVSVRMGDMNLSAVNLEFEVAVTNPYSFALPLLAFDYQLSTGEQPFLDGASDVSGSVPAKGRKLLRFPVRVSLPALFETVRNVRLGQVLPYSAEMGLSVEISGADPLRLPLHKTGEMPIPALPSINIRTAEWEELSPSRVSGALVIDLGNPNEFPFTLKSMGYELSLSRVEVARGENAPELELSPGQSGELRIPLSFSPLSAGTALLPVLQGQALPYEFLGSLVIETSFGAMTLPFARNGSVE